ncbi:Outer membrane porin protein [Paraburkholderia caffeinitolerans]|uniref:Outer membrane porin protein n=2 Tax=Paraburkholderia caffeinitolerans TaxID=1723730 RepID=A0A6J5GWN7_9BURK|nr:porin [Paraburkholderia caffeinitolerans]CAB3808405.1 Outer membrane porin protein [Paraburkholderia caffeinitolerans]
MKKVLGALALAATVSAPAFAQSSVTLYGIVDTGVEYFTHATPTGGSMVRMPVVGGGDMPSRWGLKGAEDLGGGMKAIFTLESGFSAANGALQQGGRLFGRQAYVGLSGPWGQLTFGRQYSMTNWGMAESNVMGAGGFGGLASFDPYLLAARFDNSVVYMGTFSGLTVGTSYSFGRDASAAGNCPGQSGNDFLACRAISAMLKYDHDAWGVAATYDEQRGGAGATPVTVVPGAAGIAFTKSGDTDRRYQLAAHVDIKSVRVGAGWLHRVIEGDSRSAKTDIEYLGVSVPYSAWIFDAQVAHVGSDGYDAHGTMGTLRANYNLSKRTAIYGVFAYMKNSGQQGIYSVSASSAVPAAPHPGSNQLGVEIGVRHLF